MKKDCRLQARDICLKQLIAFQEINRGYESRLRFLENGEASIDVLVNIILHLKY